MLETIAKELFDYNKKGIVKGLKDLLFPSLSYRGRLGKVLKKATEDTSKRYPSSDGRPPVPFYENLQITEQIFNFLLFSGLGNEVREDDWRETNISFPETSLDFFTRRVEYYFFKDSTLKKQYEQNNHQWASIQSLNAAIRSENKIDSLTSTVNDLQELIKIPVLIDVIDNYFSLIKDFKPLTALDQLDQLEELLGRYSYPSQAYSEMHFLRGKSYELLLDYEKACQSFLNAFRLNQESLKYAESLLASSVIAKEETAKNLAIDALKRDNHNPILLAWELTGLPSEELEQKIEARSGLLPWDDIAFKRFMATILIQNKSQNLIEPIFQNELASLQIPESITFENISYWEIITQVYFSKLSPYILTPFDIKTGRLVSSSYLTAAISVASKIESKIDGTEIENKRHLINHIIHIGQYIKGEDETDFDDLVFTTRKLKGNNYYALLLTTFVFYHEEEFEKLIELLEDYPGSEAAILQHLAFAYLFTDEKEKAFQTSLMIFNSKPEIDDYLIQSIVFLIGLISEIETEDSQKKVIEIINSSRYSEERVRDFLRFLFNWKTGNISDINLFFNELEGVGESLPIGKINYFLILASQASTAKNYSLASHFLEMVLGELEESESWLFYFNCLHRSRNRNKDLLSYLREWRQKFSLREDLLIIECEILNQVPSPKELEEVSLIGIDHFGDSHPFKWYHLRALYYDRKEQAFLDKYIDYKNKIPLQESVLVVADMLSSLNHHWEALEILFPQSSNPKKKNYRDRYFHIFLNLGNHISQDLYFNTAQEDTVVTLINDEEVIEIEISQETINADTRVILVRDKEVGSVISFGDVNFIIKSIKHIYLALFQEINRELGNPHTTGLSAEAFSAPEDLELLTSYLIERFGKEGEVNKVQFQDALEKYQSGKLGLLEFAFRFIHNDPIEAYHFLSSQGPGILVPRSRYTGDSKRFVIDLSVLPLLFELAKEDYLKNAFSRLVFYLPFSHFSLLDNMMRSHEMLGMKGDGMNMAISLSGINATKSPAEMHQKKAEYYKRLLQWVEENCEIQGSSQGLDFLNSLDESVRQNYQKNLQVRAVFDSIFLTLGTNSVLLTNDFPSYSHFHSSIPIVSIDQVMEKVLLSKADVNALKVQLIKNRYKGIFVDLDTLGHAFHLNENGIFKPDNNIIFLNAFENLLIFLPHHHELLLGLILFIKDEIYFGIQDRVMQGILARDLLKRLIQVVVRSEITSYANLRKKILDAFSSSIIVVQQSYIKEDISIIEQTIVVENSTQSS